MSAAAATPSMEEVLATTRANILQWEQEGLEKVLPPLEPNVVDEFWTTITLPSGFESRCKVMRPKNMGQKHPLVVLFHGGGFAAGSPDSMTRPGRELARELGAVVVGPTYKLAPENGWRDVFGSAWEVLCHLSQAAVKGERDGFGADPLGAGFVVGGGSAGGALASSLATLSLLPPSAVPDRKIELIAPITGVWANTPAVVQKREVLPEEMRGLWTSLQDNYESPYGFDGAGVDMMWRNLACEDPFSVWVSPFNSLDVAFPRSDKPMEEEGGWKRPATPRFVIQACQHDPLRDDGLLLERALRERGVETRLDFFKDDGHVAWMGFLFQPRTEGAGKITMDGLAWLLGKELE